MPVPPPSGLHKSVRDALPVRLGDRKYNIDLARLGRTTIDPIRQGFDTAGQPGEQSLNQAGVWKRTRTDWELGAGQQDGDMMESQLREYHTSLGIDPWTKGELKLHRSVNDTFNPGVSVSTRKYYFEPAGVTATGDTAYVYQADIWVSGGTFNGTIWYSDNGGMSFAYITGSNVTDGRFGGLTMDIASDGTNLFVAGDDFVNTVTDGVELVAGKWTGVKEAGDPDIDGLWVAGGYLLASMGPRLTWLAGDPSAPDAPDTGFDICGQSFPQVDNWVDVLGCPVGIYAAANKGTRGKIFYIGINNSNSSLDVPIIATELPRGETVNAIVEYGGYVIIGTNKGIRMAKITGDGYLTYGPRIDITNGVTHLEEQGEFIWFSWSNYDEYRTGLGRLSMRELTQPMVPAYASDLMAGDLGPRDPTAGDAGVTDVLYGPVQGPITSIITIRLNGVDTRLFSVWDEAVEPNSGPWRESLTHYVTDGTLSEGRFRWGITELKAAVSVDLRHAPLAESESVEIKLTDDAGGTTTVSSSTELTSTPGVTALADQTPENQGGAGINPVVGEFLVPEVTLRGPRTSSPSLYRWTTRAIPMPFVAEVIQLPIILTEQTEFEDRHVYQDIYDDYQYLRTLLEDRILTTFIIGNETKNVYVSGIAYEPGSLQKWSGSAQRKYVEGGRRDRWPEGTITVTLITVQTGATLVPTDYSSTG